MKFSDKLSFIIATTGITVLLLFSYVTYRVNDNALMKTQLLYSQSIATEIAEDIDNILVEKVKTALTLANTPNIIEALLASNLSYGRMSDEKRKETITRNNRKWKSITDSTDQYITKFTDNAVANALKKQQEILPGEYGEIFLTNRFGALVASTAKLSTFTHGHKYWWQGAYNKGEGLIFFDDRGYDDSVGGYVLGLVVPIKKGTEIIGILKCNLNLLGNISELLSIAEDTSIGRFKLIRSGGMVVFEEGSEPMSTRVADSLVAHIQTKNNGSIIITDHSRKVLVGLAEIKLTSGENEYAFGGTFESVDHKKGNTGESWYIICSRQLDEVRAPIITSLKTLVTIGIALVFVLAFVSFLVGRKIATPLAILNKATEKIGEGNFEYRVEMDGQDEFGKLAHSFNHMTKTLQQTTTSIKRLEESEERWQFALDGSRDGVWDWNPISNKVYFSNNWKEMLGYSENEISNTLEEWDKRVHPDDKRQCYLDLNRHLNGETPFYENEHRLLCKDGSYKWILDRGKVMSWSEENKALRVIGTHTDISERKLAEKEKEKLISQLNQAQKMEAIGTLAGGIAHDFNNILSAILGYSEMAREELSPDSQAGQDIQEVINAGMRAKDLVQQILTFSRQTERELIQIQIQYLAKEAIKLLRPTIPATIELRQNIHSGCGSVFADPTQINQIIMNLCTNARHAMGDDAGVLYIAVESITVEPGDADHDDPFDILAGRYVRLTVSDTGHGMSRDIMDRMFDPFFTTKGIGEGTGLGLAVIHGIVRSYNGFIKVNSELGQGTSFQIYLPELEHSNQVEAVMQADERSHGQEHILVVDDEEILVTMVERMLVSVGYTVTSCTDSLLALELFKAEPDKFDLILTDMAMPNMSGKVLTQKILDIRPDAVIIICTGFSNSLDEDDVRSLGVAKYIHKPVIRSDLAKQIRKVLDRNSGKGDG